MQSACQVRARTLDAPAPRATTTLYVVVVMPTPTVDLTSTLGAGPTCVMCQA